MPHLDEGTLHALLDGEIPSSELAPLRAHLDACAACSARLAEEQELLDQSDRLVELLQPPVAPPAAVAASRSPGSRIPPVPRYRWARGIGWAASLIAAAGLGYVWRDTRGSAPDAELLVASKPAAPTLEPAPIRQEAPSENVLRDQLASPADRPAGRTASRHPRPAGQPRRDTMIVATDIAPTAEKSAEPAAEQTGTPPPAAAAAPAPSPAAPPAATLGSLNRVTSKLRGLAQQEAAPAAISFPAAVALLDGRLRLIEGLVPERLESAGKSVRVIYRIGGRELVLQEELAGGQLVARLTGPPGFPPDSLELLRARVRD